MRWVVELAFAVAILGLALSLYNYVTPASISVSASERGKFLELTEFLVRLATNAEFLYAVQRDSVSAVEQANREVARIDPLASIVLTRPVGGGCPEVPAPRFSLSVASVLPNGTAICIVVRA